MNKCASENNIHSITLKRKKVPTSLTLSSLCSQLNDDSVNEEYWFSNQSPSSISTFSLQNDFTNGKRIKFFRRKWKSIVYSIIFVIRLRMSKKNGKKLKTKIKQVKSYFSSSFITQSPIKFIDSMEKSDSSCNSSRCAPKSPKSTMSKSLSSTDLRESSSKIHSFPRTACEKFYKTLTERRPLVKSSIMKKLNLKSRNLKDNFRSTIDSLESINETDSHFNENSIQEIIISPQSQINVSSIIKMASINATPTSVQRSNSMKRSISLCNLEYGEIEQSRNKKNSHKMNKGTFYAKPHSVDSLVDSNFETTTNTENSSIKYSNREQESAIFSDLNEQSDKHHPTDSSFHQMYLKPAKSLNELKVITDLLMDLLNRSISISESRSGSFLYDTVTKSDFTDVSKASDLVQNSTLNSFNTELLMASEQFIKEDVESFSSSSNKNKDSMSILSDVIISSNLELANEDRKFKSKKNRHTSSSALDFMENERAKNKAESILKATSIPMCLNLVLNNSDEQQVKPLKSILLKKSASDLKTLIKDLKDSDDEKKCPQETFFNDVDKYNLIKDNKLKYQEIKMPKHFVDFNTSHIFLDKTSEIPLNRCLMSEIDSPDKHLLITDDTIKLEEQAKESPTADSIKAPNTNVSSPSFSASPYFQNNIPTSVNFNTDTKKNSNKRKFQDAGSAYSYDDLCFVNNSINAKILTPRVRLFTINLANTIISNENANNSEKKTNDKTPLVIANFSKQQRKKESFTFYSNSSLNKKVKSFSPENASTTSIPFLFSSQQQLEQERNTITKRRRRCQSGRSILKKEKIGEKPLPNCVKCVQNFFTISRSLLVSVCDYIRRK